MRQPEAVQDPPDGAAVGIDAIGPGELRGQPIKRNFAPGGDAGFDPVCHTGQLAAPAAVALPPRRQRFGFTPQLDQIVDEFR